MKISGKKCLDINNNFDSLLISRRTDGTKIVAILYIIAKVINGFLPFIFNLTLPSSFWALVESLALIKKYILPFEIFLRSRALRRRAREMH